MIINYGKYDKDTLTEFKINYKGFQFINKVDENRIEKIIINQNDNFFRKLGYEYVFIINLDNDIEKLKSIKNKLINIGVNSFYRLNAFNGKKEILEIKKNLPEFTILSEEELIKNQNFLKNISYTKFGLGEQGCISSHIFLYKYIVQNNISKAIIMEDDVCFHSKFQELFQYSLNNIPKDGILFNYASGYADIKDSCREYNKPAWTKYSLDLCAFYIITKDGAEKLLERYSLFKKILPVADDPPFNTLENSYKLHYYNNEEFQNCGNRICGIVSSPPGGDTNSSSIASINNEKNKKNEIYKNYYNNMRKYDVFGNILSIELVEEIKNLLQEIINIFSKNNIKPILLFGTLLGYARTGKNMLQWDDDIDLGIPREEEEFVYNIINRSKNLKCIKYESDGFLPDKYLYKICLKNKENFHGRNYSYPFIDIFGYITVEKNNPILLREKVFDEDSPVIFLKPLKLIKSEFFNIKNDIYVPENYEFYLDKWFSSDWRNTCISNNWNHIDEKRINNYEKVKCQNLIPFFENNKNRDLFENTVIIDYNENGVSFLKSQLNYYNILPKIVLGDKNNMNTSHIQVIETFFKDSKNKDKYLTILEENVNLTGFFPNNLPENWDIISLNNCYDNSHCCSSINTDDKNFIEMENNIIRYKKIPNNLLISYIINLKGYKKIKKYGFNNLKLYDIFGYNPNVTKECFKSVDRYENSILPKNKYINKITSTIVIIIIMTIIIILIILIFLRKNNLKFKKTI
jgi:GR25 family glycosyltransferase involved in LPS biosynthesis